MIGVGDALANPDVQVRFDVTRRKETVSDKGRSVVTPTVFPNQVGTICAASPSDLARLPEGDRMEKYISIVSKFRLRGASTDGVDVYKPDLVDYEGDQYVVVDVQPYPRAGAGFTQAIAGSGNIVDRAP